MKIIQKGTPPRVPLMEPPWWVGKQITCPGCNTLLELEKKDGGGPKAVYAFNRQTGQITAIHVYCPVCGDGINVLRPTKV
jgi:hypothetical protein